MFVDEDYKNLLHLLPLSGDGPCIAHEFIKRTGKFNRANVINTFRFFPKIFKSYLAINTLPNNHCKFQTKAVSMVQILG